MKCWVPLALFSIMTVTRVVSAVESESEPRSPQIGHGRGVKHGSSFRSYAWQTLIVDGASLGTVLLGATQSHPGYDQELSLGTWLAATGVGGYVVGAPIVHLAHGNVGRALGSLGMRAALPILLTVGGVPVPGHCPYDYGPDESSKRTWCDPGYVGVWELAVLGPAIALDAAFLAWDEVPVERSPARASTSLRIHPTWNWHSHSLGVRICGEL